MGPQANHRRAPRPARHSFEVSRDPRGSRPWIQPTLSARRWPVPCDRARHCGMPRWRLLVRRPLARTGQCVPSASGLRSEGAVGRHEGGVWAVHELPLNEGGGSADHRGVDLNRLLRHVVEVGASDLHLKIAQPPIVRRDGTLRPARGLAAARVGTARRGRADRGRVRPAPPRRVSRERRAGYRLPAGRPAALPRERVPPARRELVRIPRDPGRRPHLRAPPASARRAATGRVPPGPDPRDRRHRCGEDDHARVDGRSHQQDPSPAHRHDRGPDRDPPCGRGLHRQSARGRARHRLLRRRRSAARSARTPT